MPNHFWSAFGASALVVILIVSLMLPKPDAQAHFFGGKTLNFDRDFQVTFVPDPAVPVAGNNSTTLLNFSVLQNNSNINNIYSALIITDKKTGLPIKQLPYKLYIFSDITIPFVFGDAGDYSIALETRIIEDPKYQAEPLKASFDLSVVNPYQAALSDKYTIVSLLIVVIAACGAIAFYGWKKM